MTFRLIPGARRDCECHCGNISIYRPRRARPARRMRPWGFALLYLLPLPSRPPCPPQHPTMPNLSSIHSRAPLIAHDKRQASATGEPFLFHAPRISFYSVSAAPFPPPSPSHVHVPYPSPRSVPQIPRPRTSPLTRGRVGLLRSPPTTQDVLDPLRSPPPRPGWCGSTGRSRTLTASCFLWPERSSWRPRLQAPLLLLLFLLFSLLLSLPLTLHLFHPLHLPRPLHLHQQQRLP